jgi:type VI secretion system protein ImpE
MNASELFQQGKLKAAIEAQIAKVKSNPTDQSARLFLFELFFFSGDLDRARKQLDNLRYERPEVTAAIESYRKALDAETNRRAVLTGQARPQFLRDVPEHAEIRLQAIASYSAQEIAAGNSLIDQANALAPGASGVLNGERVEQLRDGDDLFGPIVEVFASDKYVWVPLDQIESLTMNPLATPRDVIMRPASLTLIDGPTGDVLIPGLYFGSHLHPDEAIQVGRVSDWLGDESAPIRGAGAKLFLDGEKWVRFADWQSFGVE